MTAPQAERRQFPRVSTDLTLQLTVGDRTVETRIEDLSGSGIRFRLPEAMAVMSRVQIALALPDLDPQPIAITGVVVRSERAGESYDTAIFFEDLPESTRNHLTRFVQNRLG